MNNYTLPPSIVKVCAGLVQSATTEPYLFRPCAPLNKPCSTNTRRNNSKRHGGWLLP